jgi:pimeloyl-ACP methyl ester carboxylesterase
VPSTVVLVHGACHGSWCWERVVPLLETRGLAVRTVDLPTMGAPEGAQPGLADDMAAVRAVLDEVDGQSLLCGHSYGGTVISAAAAGRSDVSRLLYLCAAMLDGGESGAAVFEQVGIQAEWFVLEGDRLRVDRDTAAARFYGDCDPETQRAAVDRLQTMCLRPHGEPVPEAAWHAIPSTYVVCTEDRVIPAEIQRSFFAPRADEVVELQSSHSPFFSQPEALAELIAARA